MAAFDLQLVPWRVEYEAVAEYSILSEVYSGWAAELGVSDTETQVTLTGDDLATAISFDYPPFPGAVADAFIATEGGIGFYREVPGNKTSTAYDLAAQGISRMYGFATRPNLLLSFHYQNNLKILNGKIQKRYGVTILYVELSVYNSSTVRFYGAFRFEPHQAIIYSRAATYATNWILTELNPATGAVVKSSQILAQSAGSYYIQTYRLINNVGLLASPGSLPSPAQVGAVPTVGQLRGPILAPFAGLGSVGTTGHLRASPFAAPVLGGTVQWPVLASHRAEWSPVSLAQRALTAPWSEWLATRPALSAPWGLRLEAALSASWALPLHPRSHEARWGDPAVVQGSHRVSYGNNPLVADTLDSRWSDLSVSDRALLHRWGDLTPVRAEHQVPWEVAGFRGAYLESPWSDSPAASNENVLFWGDGIPPRAALSAPWGNRAEAGRAFGAAWGNGEFPRAILAAPWGETRVHRVAHLATWTTPVPVRADRATPWGDSAWVRVDLEAGWADLAPLLPVPHQARWSNRPGALRALVTAWSDGVLLGTRHAAVWASRPVVRDDLVSPWAEHPACRQGSEAGWADTVPVSADHFATWADSDTSLAVTHRLVWADQALSRGHHEITWASCPPVSGRQVSPWSDTAGVTVECLSAWSGCVLASRALVSPWDNTAGVSVAWTSLWDDLAPLAPAVHVASWSDRPSGRKALSAGWGDGLPLVADHALSWGDLTPVRRTLLSPWSVVPVARQALAAGWADTVAVPASHRLVWADRSQGRLGLDAPWADLVPVSGAHALSWSESDLRLALSHGLSWGDQSLAHGYHEISWGAAQAVGANLGAPWGNRASAGRMVGAVWGDCLPLAPSGHVSVWADQGAGRGSHLASWTEALPALQGHAAAWADASSASQALETSWADAAPSRRGLGAAWTDATPSRLTHAAVYADREAAEAGLTAPWGQMTPASRTQVAPWALTAPGRRACTLVWSLNERPAAVASHRAHWAVLEDVNLISIDNVPEVIWEGQSVQILAARLSADEESPVWIAEEIVIAERELWSAIQLGDLIQFSIHEETWLLRVDGKGMSRPQPGDMLLSISAVSPLAWLDAPYASAITLDNANEAVSARATVAALVAPVGSLTWDLDDWLIPPGALAMTETTPLQAGREIVAAIGGLLESAPDGTPVARRRHPVTVPSYGTATPEQVIQDGDLFAFKVAASPFAGFNRVVISNEDLNSEDARDRLAYFDEDANAYDGEMRAWPNPWRPAVLGHTGHPDTEITSLGERQHSHTELVEFVAGRGQVAYPVHTLTSVQWQHVDLGALAANGTDLTATVSEQSLAWVTYTTRTLDWRVGLDRDESVQFVLI